MKALWLLICTIVLLSSPIYSIEKSSVDSMENILGKTNQNKTLDIRVKNNSKDPGSGFSSKIEKSDQGPILKGVVLLSDRSDVNKCDCESTKGLEIYNLELPKNAVKLANIICNEYCGIPITKDRIIDIKTVITKFYQDDNLPIVLIQVPSQDISKGILQLVITVGRVGKVSVRGAKYFNDEKLANYIQLKPEDEINSKIINRDLFFLNRNPFRNVNVIYSPGEEEGTTDIELLVKDRYPLRVYTGIDNTGNQTTGRNRLFAGFNCGKLFGTDQQLSYQFTTSDNFKDFRSHTIYYDSPLPWRHYLVIFGGYSHVEGKYYSPSLTGTSFINKGFSAQASMRYDIPLYPNNSFLHEFTFGFDFKRTNNNLELGGIPIIAKHVNLTQMILGYNLGYKNESITTSFEIEGFYSPGHWISDQTNTAYQTIRAFAKSKYVYFRSSYTLIWRFYKNWSFYNYLRGQVATENLLPSEEFGLGGYNTVRGYPERVLNGDNAFIYNIELRAPSFGIIDSIQSKPHKLNDQFQLLAFFDIGWINKHKKNDFEKKNYDALSIGSGIRYKILPYLTSRFDYGYQLKKLDLIGSRHRLHFSVVLGY